MRTLLINNLRGITWLHFIEPADNMQISISVTLINLLHYLYLEFNLPFVFPRFLTNVKMHLHEYKFDNKRMRNLFSRVNEILGSAVELNLLVDNSFSRWRWRWRSTDGNKYRVRNQRFFLCEVELTQLFDVEVEAD